VNKSKWGFDELIFEGEQRGEQRGVLRGEQKGHKETAYEMFMDGENILKIRKYSKLPDKDLADVLHGLPAEIQTKYNLSVN
jgi:predicted transposase YdaD